MGGRLTDAVSLLSKFEALIPCGYESIGGLGVLV